MTSHIISNTRNIPYGIMPASAWKDSQLVKDMALPVLFADDTSILITGQDANKLQEDLTLTFIQVSEWFKQNWTLNTIETCTKNLY